MHNDTPLVPMQLPREVIEYCERTGITHALIAMCFMSIKVGDADHGIFISPDIEVYPRLVGDTDHRQPVYGAKKLTGDLRQSRGYPGLIQEYGCVNKRCIVLGPKGDIEAGDTIFRTLMDIKTGIVMVGHNTIATVFEKVTAHSIGANGCTEDMLLISLQSSREDPTGSVMWETTFEVDEQYGTRHASGAWLICMPQGLDFSHPSMPLNSCKP